MVRYLALAIFLIAALTSCTKEEGKYFSVDSFARDLFLWKEGSYWIMRDSVTSQRDSFYVKTYSSSENRGNYEDKYEIIRIEIREVNGTNPALTTDWRLYLNSYDGSSSFGNTVSFPFYPFPLYASDIRMKSNGREYEHVYYNSSQIQYPTSSSTRFVSVHFNKESGILKLQMQDSLYKPVWLLEKSHIITN